VIRDPPPLLRYGALPIERTQAGGAVEYPVVPPGLLRFDGRFPRLKAEAERRPRMKRNVWRNSLRYASGATRLAVPVGGSPTGTGGSPVLPWGLSHWVKVSHTRSNRVKPLFDP
jgi:hypothetical protein